MTGPLRVRGSFRDPAGFVFERDGRVYRQVNRSFAARFDEVVASGLYDVLHAEGLLIPHREAALYLAASEEAHRVLEPKAIPFVSYPYEWCFGQLKDAALATLGAQWAALDRGMTLRDASAYNVQFLEGGPVLIDSLSFEPWTEGRPWAGYAQFCQHFLAPLAMMSAVDVRLGGLLRVHLDGVPLDLATALLPRRARLRPSVWLHLVAHGKAQRRHTRQGESAPSERSRVSSTRFDLRAFRGLVDSLERAVEGLRWDPPPSVWSEYYGECTTYPPQALNRKESVVEGFVREARPATVWDLGANTGRFSRLAARSGAFTVSLDADHVVVEAGYREARRLHEGRVLPLVVDLVNPSPAIGWAEEERASLLARGPADLVMALALVHHLAIANNVPLDRLAAFLARVGRWAVVEFVPKEDPQVRALLATREDVFPDYTVEAFERAIEEPFAVVRKEGLPGSPRVLYLLRSRS